MPFLPDLVCSSWVLNVLGDECLDLGEAALHLGHVLLNVVRQRELGLQPRKGYELQVRGLRVASKRQRGRAVRYRGRGNGTSMIQSAPPPPIQYFSTPLGISSSALWLSTSGREGGDGPVERGDVDLVVRFGVRRGLPRKGKGKGKREKEKEKGKREKGKGKREKGKGKREKGKGKREKTKRTVIYRFSGGYFA